MKFRIIAGFVMMLVLLTLIVASGQRVDKRELSNAEYKQIVNVEVNEKLAKEGRVNVLIKVKEVNTLNLNSLSSVSSSGEKFQAGYYKGYLETSVNAKELNDMIAQGIVEKVSVSHEFKAMLQDSIVIINATRSWPLQVTGVNITGVDQTVCVIDTGINFTHPSLSGKNKTCVIDCYAQDCAEDCSIADDHGHGTHIAGTIAASSGILGVGPGISLIGLKVLNSAGSSSGTPETDLAKAIDWCTANRNLYNISVISMSLGTTAVYNGYCDSDYSFWAEPINNATAHNISVVIASGNSGSGVPRNTTHISSPGCIENASAVSATNKDDSIASYAHYSSIVSFFAPGTSINSSCASLDPENVAGYCTKSGTSMATPHVAGAFALINQFYLTFKGRTYTPLEIKNALRATGKNITATNTTGNVIIPRINIYQAIISLDDSLPIVTLITPANNSAILAGNQSFLCSATDLVLKNLTFFLWNSSGEVVNQSYYALSGANYSLNLTIQNLSAGSYQWNCEAYDLNNNLGRASANHSLTVSSIAVSLNSLSTQTRTNVNQSYNCSAVSTVNMTNVSFFLWNSSGGEVFNELKNVSGTTNSSVFNANFSTEGDYSWNCKFSDLLGNRVFASENYSISYDITSPQLAVISPLNNRWVNSGRFNVSLNENGSCEYSIDSGVNNKSMSVYAGFNVSATNNTLAQGLAYNLTYYCNDSAGNLNNSQIVQFSVDLTTPNVTLIEPSSNPSATGTQSVLFSYNASDNLNISSCSLIINGAIVLTNSSAITNSTNNFTRTLSAGTHNWRVNCTDEAGNIGNSSLRSLVISETASTTSSSSGGGSSGGGGGTTNGTTYLPDTNQLSLGYTRTVGKDDKVQIMIVNSRGFNETHLVGAEVINTSYAKITIRSEPIVVNLLMGESAKVNITSANFYELFVKLESISENRANLTIKAIHEEIPVLNQTKESEGSNNQTDNAGKINKEKVRGSANLSIKKGSYMILGVVLLIIVSIYVMKKLKMRKLKRELEALEHKIYNPKFKS